MNYLYTFTFKGYSKIVAETDKQANKVWSELLEKIEDEIDITKWDLDSIEPLEKEAKEK